MVKYCRQVGVVASMILVTGTSSGRGASVSASWRIRPSIREVWAIPRR